MKKPEEPSSNIGVSVHPLILLYRTFLYLTEIAKNQSSVSFSDFITILLINRSSSTLSASLMPSFHSCSVVCSTRASFHWSLISRATLSDHQTTASAWSSPLIRLSRYRRHRPSNPQPTHLPLPVPPFNPVIRANDHEDAYRCYPPAIPPLPKRYTNAMPTPCCNLKSCFAKYHFDVRSFVTPLRKNLCGHGPLIKAVTFPLWVVRGKVIMRTGVVIWTRRLFSNTTWRN